MRYDSSMGMPCKGATPLSRAHHEDTSIWHVQAGATCKKDLAQRCKSEGGSKHLGWVSSKDAMVERDDTAKRFMLKNETLPSNGYTPGKEKEMQWNKGSASRTNL